MKIIWRDDVRFEQWTDTDGVSYAYPFAKKSPLPGRVAGKALVARQRERVLARALARKKALEGLPVHSPIRRRLAYQETAGGIAVQRVSSERAARSVPRGNPLVGVDTGQGVRRQG